MPPTTYHNDGVAYSPTAISDQGEKSVGAATVQLAATATPCTSVWLGAPTAQHTVGELNTSPILVGKESGGNESGGIPIEADNHKGVLILIDDASKLYLTGFTAGDVVEYQIFR